MSKYKNMTIEQVIDKIKFYPKEKRTIKFYDATIDKDVEINTNEIRYMSLFKGGIKIVTSNNKVYYTNFLFFE